MKILHSFFFLWILTGVAGFALAADQCDNTAQCKTLFGSTATDCRDSKSENSVCICGSKPCSTSGGGGSSSGGGVSSSGGGGSSAGGGSTSADRLFFQNDWDGNDSDNRNCARDWEKEDVWRHAWALFDEKNTKNKPSTRTLNLAEGAQRVADASRTGKVNIAMGGGAGQMLLLLKEVKNRNGNLANIRVISHSSANEANKNGAAGQYPPFGSAALQQVKSLIGSNNFVNIPNQNNHAYGARGNGKSTDVSDFGMLHYVVYGDSTPDNRRLFD